MRGWVCFRWRWRGQFREVTAVESGAGAVRDLEFNAERAGLANLRAEQADSGRVPGVVSSAPRISSCWIRRGPGWVRPWWRGFAELAPRRVTIVACDPATLARDLAGLTAAGYGIEQMMMVDLFPQTYHLETVVHLGRP